jgi:hypothetical protein
MDLDKHVWQAELYLSRSHPLLGSSVDAYAACGAIATMRSASRAAEIRSSSGMVG